MHNALLLLAITAIAHASNSTNFYYTPGMLLSMLHPLTHVRSGQSIAPDCIAFKSNETCPSHVCFWSYETGIDTCHGAYETCPTNMSYTDNLSQLRSLSLIYHLRRLLCVPKECVSNLYIWMFYARGFIIKIKTTYMPTHLLFLFKDVRRSAITRLLVTLEGALTTHRAHAWQVGRLLPR